MDYFLSRLPAFIKLPKSTLAGLPGKLPITRFNKNEPIFEEGNKADAVFILRSGLVKAVKYSPRIEPASMGIIAPGQMFGLIAVLDKKPYPVSAIPLQESEVYRIGADLFTEMMEAHPEFSKQVYATLGDHLRQAQELRALAKGSAEQRVAHILRTLSSAMGKNLSVRRGDIGELAGCTPETATRILSAFRKKGWIASGWKRITVLKLDALTRLIERS